MSTQIARPPPTAWGAAAPARFSGPVLVPAPPNTLGTPPSTPGTRHLGTEEVFGSGRCLEFKRKMFGWFCHLRRRGVGQKCDMAPHHQAVAALRISRSFRSKSALDLDGACRSTRSIEENNETPLPPPPPPPSPAPPLPPLPSQTWRLAASLLSARAKLPPKPSANTVFGGFPTPETSQILWLRASRETSESVCVHRFVFLVASKTDVFCVHPVASVES